MTHEELLRALEWCAEDKRCDKCEMRKKHGNFCMHRLIVAALKEIRALDEAYESMARELRRKHAQVEDLRRQTEDAT